MTEMDGELDPFGRPLDTGGSAVLVPADQVKASIAAARREDAESAGDLMKQIGELSDAEIAALELEASGELDDDDPDIDYGELLAKPPE